MESLHEDALCLADDVPAQQRLLEAFDLVVQLLDQVGRVTLFGLIPHPLLRPATAPGAGPKSLPMMVSPPLPVPPTRVGNSRRNCSRRQRPLPARWPTSRGPEVGAEG